MGELVSQRAFAKLMGVSQPAVNKAIKSGRIKLINGKIDPDQAARAWEANTDKAQQRGHGKAGAPAEPEGRQPGTDDGATVPEYSRSRQIIAAFEARIAQIDYQEKVGKLVSADEVRLKAFNGARRARDLLMAIADRISPILAATEDQFEVHRLLSDEIRLVCEEISRGNR